MRVLLVCADPAVAAQVRSALGGPDSDIQHVATPQRAVALVDEGEVYDVVVADADMTPTGGFALARELRARELMGDPAPRLVLLITRHEDSWLASWSRADASVRKPVDPFDLAAVVDALANGRDVPERPGVAVPSAPISGDIFGIEEGATHAGAVTSGGP